MAVAGSAAIAAVKNIIPSKAALNSTKSLAILLVKSCLEGQGDNLVHTTLRNSIEHSMLRSFGEELMDKLFDEDFVIDYYDEKTTFAHILEALRGKRDTEVSCDDDEMEDLAYALCSNMFVEQELFGEKAKATIIEGEDSDQNMEKDISSQGRIGRVEVFWGGRVERVNFPLPPESDSLTAKMKHRFLSQNVTLVEGDTGQRVYELVAEADRIQGEMKALHDVSATKKACNSSIMAISASIVLLFGQCDAHCLSSRHDDRHQS